MVVEVALYVLISSSMAAEHRKLDSGVHNRNKVIGSMVVWMIHQRDFMPDKVAA